MKPLHSLKRVVVIAVLLMSATDIWSMPSPNNKVNFNYITYQNGLTSSNVYDICIDKNGCLWIGTETGLSRYDGYFITNFFKEEMNVRSNVIRYLHCDRYNRLWIGSSNGVGIYDINENKFITLELLINELIENKTAWFFEDSEGTMWVSFKKMGLMSIDPKTFATKKFFNERVGKDYFSRIWFEPENGLYLASKYWDGLHFLNLETSEIIPFTPADNPSEEPFAGRHIRGLIKVNEKDFCISCEDGTMWLVNPYERSYEQLPLNVPEKESLELCNISVVGENKIVVALDTGVILYDLKKKRVLNYEAIKEFKDKEIYCLEGSLEDGLIFGIVDGGIAIQQDEGYSFKSIKTDRNNKRVSLQGSVVSGFAQTNDSTVWVSTKLKGLYRYDIKRRRLQHIDNTLLPNEIEDIVPFKEQLWMLSSSGIYALDIESKEVKAYREGCCNNINLIKTSDDRLVAHTEDGLMEYNPDTDCFNNIRNFNDYNITAIGYSENNRLLVMTEEKGLMRWNANGTLSVIISKFKFELSGQWSGYLYEDENDFIWAAPPNEGVAIIQDQTFNKITTRSGLASNVITNIINDDNGNVFITTDRSLSMVSTSGKMYSRTKSDGLLNYGFTRNSAFKTLDGDIYIGSRDGFTIIPNSKKNTIPHIAPRKPVKISANGAEKSLTSNRKAILHRQENTFEISINDIDPHNIITGRTLFCLEGYDNTWTPVGQDGKISYFGLNPGKYLFKSYDNSVEPIIIRVRRHPLVSVTAQIIYLMLSMALMSLIIVYIRRNEVRKRKEKTTQMKIDLHQEKIDFFINIAHEIKTPLTLITTPLTHLKNNPSIDKEARYDIDVMDKHASYLLSLIKELLEFSKIENNKLSINSKVLDICSTLNNITANFIEQNELIKWDINIPKTPILVMADISATTKILNNLIFNAIKYTESFIKIEMSQSEDGFATIVITNDGNVIPVEMRDRIFDSFVQYKTGKQDNNIDGFGIGLSVAKTLAHLQEGSLSMGKSTELNEFIFKVPLSTVPIEQEAEKEVETVAEGDINNENRNTILVVEDHPELLEYIRKTLSAQYHVLIAENGRMGFETIKTHSNIDLVLTDLKMPEMSGMELCTMIKQNPTFSHILVVILSANLTPEMKVASMKNGADAIIEKPFSVDFLLSRVENLINSRRKMIEMISKDKNFVYEEVKNEEASGLSVRDIVFLQQLNDIVEKNFSDPDFGIDELADALNLSRSSLNRKMRDILNDTANNYIREKRLTLAEELLRTSSLQINEICYKVGFQTPSYFIKCFRKKYGKSPNEYANSAE